MENIENFQAVPTLEKVQGLIDKFTNGAEVQIKKERYNEEGVLVEAEIQVLGVDAKGNIIQFDYLVNKVGRITVDEMRFGEDGMSLDGKQVAEYGNWKML